MIARIYGPDGEPLSIVEGTPEQIELNVPPGGRWEPIAAEDLSRTAPE